MTLTLALLAFFGLGMTACEKKGPLEKAGDTIEEGAQDAGRAVEEGAEDAGHAVEDAVD